MASKEEDDEMYFYFYCQEKKTKSVLEFDLKITNYKDLHMTLKSEDSKLNREFIGYFRQFLDEEFAN